MGLMMLGFSLLDVGELKMIFKQSAAASKIAMAYRGDIKSSVEALSKKFVSGGQIADWEKVALNDLKDVFKKNGKNIVEEKLKEGINKNLKNIKEVFKQSNMGFKDFWTLITAYAKAGKLDVLKIPVTLGGIFTVPYTLDQLYLALYGNDDDRKNSPLFKAFITSKNWTMEQFNLKTPEEQKNELNNFLNELKKQTSLERLLEALENFNQKYELSEKGLEIMPKITEPDSNVFKNTFSKSEVSQTEFKFTTPKLIDVENGTHHLFEGMAGDSVSEIQKILKNKWKYDIGDTGVNRDGIDGVYDDRMVEKIKTFQQSVFFGLDEKIKKDNIPPNMDVTGEVDKVTLWYLKNANPENLKMTTLKLIPMTAQYLTDENANFYVNNKKYYLFRPSKNEWVEQTKEEYEERKNKGLKVDVKDDWKKISKTEYLNHTSKGLETKYEEKREIIKPQNKELENKKRKPGLIKLS
jgi:peptidoglycan hydrolase-like protein with peptidoglycan-binding domain